MFNELFECITNDVFPSSLSSYITGLSISSIVMSILAVFMILGAYDKLNGNKRGYGAEFDKGFQAMGDLALAIVGIVSLSPVLLLILSPLVTPLYNLIGASPAMFAGSLLSLDMGGYAMSIQMAGENAAIGNYAGLIVASMMGLTLSFTLPIALTILKKEDQTLFAVGILLGIVTLPIGCLVGGFMMNFTSTPLTMHELIINTLPVIFLAVLVGLGLILKQNLMLKLFAIFGKCITILATVSLGIAIFQYLTGIRLPLFYLMVEEDPILGGVPLMVGIMLVGLIAVFLAGAFPMVLFLKRRLAKPMDWVGEKIGVNRDSSTALLTQLASNLPIWNQLETFDSRGKLVNVVFTVSGSFVLGDVLAFIGGANPEMVFPAIVGKLTAGVLAVALTVYLLQRNILKIEKLASCTVIPEFEKSVVCDGIIDFEQT
ncbi:ethanolamine utilization protein EutH [Methanimicrococcus sp. OttesenSCG-928-J09]|nr:ethanolamine utilization protein EutH [Methanimicrococcus sp. OttesenSCG-928-J09]